MNWREQQVKSASSENHTELIGLVPESNKANDV